MNIGAIITDSFSGYTARNLAAFRGKNPVLAICYNEKTMRHLALSYGVEAIYMPEQPNGQAYYFAALHKLLQDGVIREMRWWLTLAVASRALIPLTWKSTRWVTC